MNSAELNEGIRNLEDALPDMGKPIPYIGWFWREVDFDDRRWPPRFGIIPASTPEWTSHFRGEETKGPELGYEYIGFMESNKWDYPYSRSLTEAEAAELRRLLEVAVTEKTSAAVGAVRDFIAKFAATAVLS